MRRAGVFATVHTNGLELLNPDGSVPPLGSVMTIREKGGVLPTLDVSLNSITVTGAAILDTVQAASVDVSGNITAQSITVGKRMQGRTALLSVANNIVVQNANISVTGDANTTGYVTAQALTLNDLSSGNETYLYVDSTGLNWQGADGSTVPITQNMSVSTNITPPTSSSDQEQIYTALMTLLNIFNSRGMFISLDKAPPKLQFNSPAKMRIVITQNTVIRKDISVSYGTNRSNTSESLLTLCDKLTNLIGTTSTGIQYCIFQYNRANGSVTIIPSEGYEYTITDVSDGTLTCNGSARLFLNHMGFYGSNVLDVGTRYTTSKTSKSLIDIPTNDDAPYPPPAVVKDNTPSSGYCNLTITRPTHEGSLQAGNTLQGYAIYVDNKPVTNFSIFGKPDPYTYKLLLTPSLNPPIQKVAVVALDLFNQSLATFLEISQTPMPWPPTGAIQGYIEDNIRVRASPDFLQGGAFIKYDIYQDNFSRSYSFTICSPEDLINQCLAISVDDSVIIHIEGLQPVTYNGITLTPPDPLVNVRGPQAGYGWGGTIQFSQPITLKAQQKYKCTINYSNLKGSCGFTMFYIDPGNLWSAGPDYKCPELVSYIETYSHAPLRSISQYIWYGI